MNDAAVENGHEAGTRTALGTLLIERGFLDGGRLEEALRIGEDTGERLGEVVVRMGWASEDDLARTLAEQWHLRYVERSAISFDGDALRRMSREDATRLEALPMQVREDGALVVGLAEPTDARLTTLRSLLGDRIDCVVVAKGAIDAGLRSDLLAKSPADVAAAAGEDARPTTADFDDVARHLTDAVGAHLDSLRAIAVEAQAARERDRLELARLRLELGERNEAIESLQQTLRDLADGLTPH
jgi:hypothetical protein